MLNLIDLMNVYHNICRYIEISRFLHKAHVFLYLAHLDACNMMKTLDLKHLKHVYRNNGSRNSVT